MTSETSVPSLILASSSRYRQQLLSRLGVEFSVSRPNIDETALTGETPEQLVLRLAETKAAQIAEQHPDSIVIGSDQVAVCGNRIIGKPLTHQTALEQLSQFSGKSLIFLTSICVYRSADRYCDKTVVPCTVVFRPLGRQQLEKYLQIERPYDCAGSFKSEGLGIALLERMETDDPTALIGLPLIRLSRMLDRAGIPIL